MTKTEGLSELLPCPFCGDQMNLDHGTLKHSEQGKCVIGAYAWDGKFIAAWNRRAANSAGRVEVKALVWDDTEWPRLAGSLGMHYRIYGGRPAGNFRLVYPDKSEAFFDTIKAAKAAAQADFNQRILSALTSAVEAEPVALTDEKVTLHRFRPTGAENWSEWRVGPVRFSDRVLSGMEAQQSDFYTHPSSPVSAEVTEAGASDDVKAILDVHSHLMRHTKEPYFISSRDSYRLMGPLLRAAVKLEKLERAALNGGRENG